MSKIVPRKQVSLKGNLVSLKSISITVATKAREKKGKVTHNIQFTTV